MSHEETKVIPVEDGPDELFGGNRSFTITSVVEADGLSLPGRVLRVYCCIWKDDGETNFGIPTSAQGNR